MRYSSISLLAATVLWLVLAHATMAQESASDSFIAIGIGKLAYEIRSDGETFFDTTAHQLKMSWGVRLTRNWDFEFSYQISGSATKPGLPRKLAEEPAFAALPGTLAALTTARLEIASVRAVRRFPQRWGTLYTALGASGAAVETDLEIIGAGPISANIHTSKNGFTAGTGLEWSGTWAVFRLEYEWWDADMSGITISIKRPL